MTVLNDTGDPAESTSAEIMTWRRTYPGRPEQAPGIRRFVNCLLADFPRVDDIVTATAELVANAIAHTRSGGPDGRLTIEVRHWPNCCVALSVTDQGSPGIPRIPEPNDDDPFEEHGRGLLILDAASTCWGWTGDTRGRTVTALFVE
jgi:serine/threonine-protein kinase RsbW